MLKFIFYVRIQSPLWRLKDLSINIISRLCLGYNLEQVRNLFLLHYTAPHPNYSMASSKLSWLVSSSKRCSKMFLLFSFCVQNICANIVQSHLHGLAVVVLLLIYFFFSASCSIVSPLFSKKLIPCCLEARAT